jgi:hypothetical protein
MDNKLIAEIKRRGIPPLYAQENKEDPTIYLEISLLQFPWRWYVSEAQIEDDGRNVLFFGFVNGDFNEWGYFRLSELEDSRCPLLVSYDFQPKPFSELKKEYKL